MGVSHAVKIGLSFYPMQRNVLLCSFLPYKKFIGGAIPSEGEEERRLSAEFRAVPEKAETGALKIFFKIGSNFFKTVHLSNRIAMENPREGRP